MIADPMTHHQFHHQRSAQPQRHFFNSDRNAFQNAKMLKKPHAKWAHAERDVPNRLKSINKPQKPFHKGNKGVYNGPVPKHAGHQPTVAEGVSRPLQGRQISPKQHQQHFQQPPQPKHFFADLNSHKKSPKEVPLIPAIPTTSAANENKPFAMVPQPQPSPPQQQQQQNTVVPGKPSRQVLRSPFFEGKFDIARLVECAAKGLFFD
ncbi:hypothetical protein QR680_018339 [Steinernema hermaphroditum]|uniref:Uncharacterized protein n=1 Tax=Steinernema hermaphroditum TaxID=289476 RepID=A0AA39HJZ8_9BILA|nr:hypothetical protein QR680_018339 [Steinernema hermaphroditum]